MNKKIFATIILQFLIISTLNGQVTQDWASIYNGTGNGADKANSIAVDGLGNVYVTGQSVGSGTSFDYVTIKYNSAGVELWTAIYNGPGNSDDWAYSIAVDGSGNVYVTGGSGGSGTLDDYATIKYNSAGVEQWVQRYDGSGNGEDVASSIAVDGLGNVYVTGQSFGSGTFDDYYTIKYNTDGVWQWGQRYNGTDNSADRASSVSVDGSGNVYVTGQSMGSGTSSDYVTIKYNSDGVGLWLQLYNGPGNGYDEARSLAVDGFENVYVTGGSMGSGTGTSDYATIKYNSSGYQQWEARYNGPGNSSDDAYSIAVGGSGNVYVTGRSWGNVSTTGEDYATIKYNSDGLEQWVQRYNGTGNGYDYAYSIAVDGSENAYVTGRSFGNGSGSDYATVKYNSSGAEEWTAIYNGLGNDYDMSSSITVDGSGKVYVTGQSTVGAAYAEDYVTIKYSQAGGGGTQVTLLQEGFDQSFPPNGWQAQVLNSAYTWQQGNPQGNDFNQIDPSSTNSAICPWVAENQDEWLITTSFNLGNGNASLEFYAAYSTQYLSGATMKLHISTNGGANWQEIWSAENDGQGFMWRQKTIDLSAYQNKQNLKLAWQYVGNDGDLVGLDGIKLVGFPTSVGDISREIPTGFELCYNYPNPFNPSTTIQFQIPKFSFIKINVYDILGNEVATLVNEEKPAGSYDVNFNASQLSSGVYFYKLQAGSFVQTKKMILIK